VAVGHETLMEGDQNDPPCVRTGVTAVDVPDRNLY
jgi:L-aminopeptidase/D-esterase-like protein